MAFPSSSASNIYATGVSVPKQNQIFERSNTNLDMGYRVYKHSVEHQVCTSESCMCSQLSMEPKKAIQRGISSLDRPLAPFLGLPICRSKLEATVSKRPVGMNKGSTNFWLGYLGRGRFLSVSVSSPKNGYLKKTTHANLGPKHLAPFFLARCEQLLHTHFACDPCLLRDGPQSLGGLLLRVISGGGPARNWHANQSNGKHRNTAADARKVKQICLLLPENATHRPEACRDTLLCPLFPKFILGRCLNPPDRDLFGVRTLI